MTAPVVKLIPIIAACLLLAGCAQTGPPLPPSLELPKPPSDLRASRKGNNVTLIWTAPTRTTDRQSIRSLGETHICRSTDPDMTTCGNPIHAISPSQTPASTAQAAEPQVFTDELSFSMQQNNPAAAVTYAVEVLNREGRGAGISNRVYVCAVPTLSPPSDLAALLTGDGVELTWTGIAETENTPDITHHYRIYRREEGSARDAVAGELAFGSSGPMRFLDFSFEWEKTYLYRVTAVTMVAHPPSGEIQIEGDDTPAVRVVARDIFPPAVPSGLQAVYSGEAPKTFIDLIWAPVTNADLAGYNVYRREADGSRTKVNSDLVKTPAYRDMSVVSGKTYTYSVSSVDVRGNESPLSDEASEHVP